jgi:hypothetical protein
VLSGTVTIKDVFSISVTLGDPAAPTNTGLMIVDGSFQLDAARFEAENINLGGVVIIQDLLIGFSKDSTSGDYQEEYALQVILPGGFGVGGSLTTRDGSVDSISLSLASPRGVPLATTGLFVSSFTGSVQNLTDTANIVVTGSIGVNYGETITLLGREVSIFRGEGGFTWDKDELVLYGCAWVGAYQTGDITQPCKGYTGLLGSGSGTLTLDWGQGRYEAEVELNMYGGVFQVKGVFAMDDNLDVLLGGEADLVVPPQIPIIGGMKLAAADFLFEYHPPIDSSSGPTGLTAAWTKINLIVHTFQIGLKADLVGNFSLLHGKEIDAYEDCISNPDECLSGSTYTYFKAFNVPAGANSALLTVSWPQATGTQTISITADQASAVNQSQFSSPTGASFPDPVGYLQLVSDMNTSTSTTVRITAATEGAVLPASTYKLTLTSTAKFDTAQVTFDSSFGYPLPTVDVAPTLPGGASDTSIVPVPLAGTVAPALADQVKLSLHLDDDNQGYDGVLIADAIPHQVDSAGNVTASTSWDLSGLLPVPYYTYAVINDGTNPPVFSAYADPVTPSPPLSCQVYDRVHGNIGVSGFPLFLDLNNNGQLDAGEPNTSTGSAGFYNFSNLAPKSGRGNLRPCLS